MLFVLSFLAACSENNNGEGMTEAGNTTETTTEERTLTTSAGERTTLSETESAIVTEEAREAQGGVTESVTKKAYDTWTGFPPLPAVTFTVNDTNNLRGLSTKKIMHSYGVPKDEKPNIQSVNNQNYFDSCGYKAVAYDNKTKEKALYLTFDCGYENGNTFKILDVLEQKKVPAAFFCTIHHIQSEPELIARIIKGGNIIGNHSAYHPDFSEIDRGRMAREILHIENYLREHFGYSSKYFRFPKGNYNENSLELVDSMGLMSVFWSSAYADWDVNNAKGASHAFNSVTSRLHPGAVILLHSVSPDNARAMADIIDYARQKGYTFRSLDDLGK